MHSPYNEYIVNLAYFLFKSPNNILGVHVYIYIYIPWPICSIKNFKMDEMVPMCPIIGSIVDDFHILFQ